MSLPDGEALRDPRYQIPGTSIFNLTKWRRENLPLAPHRYRLGDQVVAFVEDEVTHVGRDCDGTPLYRVGTTTGISEYSMLLTAPERPLGEPEELGEYRPVVDALRARGWVVTAPPGSADGAVR